MNAEILHDALNLLPGDLIAPVDQLRTAPRKPKNAWLRYAALAACAALVIWSGMLASGMFSTDSMAAAPQMEAAMGHSQVNGSGGTDGFPAEDRIQDDEKAPAEYGCAPEVMEESAPQIPAGTEIAIEPPATGYPSEPDKYYVGGSAGYSTAPGHKEGIEYPQVTVIRSLEELQNWFAEYRDFYDIDSFEAGYAHLGDTFFAEQDLLLVLLEEEYGYVCHEPYFLSLTEEDKWELTFTAHYQQEDRTADPMQWLFFIEIEKDLIGEGDSVTVEAEPYAVPEGDYVEVHTTPTEEK